MMKLIFFHLIQCSLTIDHAAGLTQATMFHILICLIFSLHRSKTKHIIHICLRSNNILRKYTKISTICFYANTFQLPTKVSPKPSKVFELFLYILITCDSLVIDLFQRHFVFYGTFFLIVMVQNTYPYNLLVKIILYSCQ